MIKPRTKGIPKQSHKCRTPGPKDTYRHPKTREVSVNRSRDDMYQPHTKAFKGILVTPEAIQEHMRVHGVRKYNRSGKEVR